MTRTGLALLLCTLGVASAHAGEGGGSAAENAIQLSGSRGLTGFMDMVDARTPGVLSLRFGTRYIVSVRDRDLGGGQAKLSQREERHALFTSGGVSLFSLVDVGARIPYLFESKDWNVKGQNDLPGEGHERGWGDFDLAAKVSLPLGWFTVAPFATGRFPVGEPDTRDLAELDYGASATFTLLSQYLSFHGNLYGLQRETGLSAFGYRLGLAGVPLATDTLLLRLYAYADGLEYEGQDGSDLDAVFGLQAIVLESITAEIGVGLRIVDGGHTDDQLRRALRTNSAVDDTRRFQDDGSWTLQLAVGTAF